VPRIVGVLLGAGSSRRLGRPKQSLMLGEHTVLARSLAAAEASCLADVCLVVGNEADAALDGVQITRAAVAYNEAYGTGCASSLLAGLDTATDAAAIVMLLGDMPTLSTAIIDSVVDSWTATPTWAAVTRYRNGILGHPFVFSAAAFDTLRGLHGDKAVWKIVDREPESRVRRIDVDADLPPDIDTWDDYLAVCARLGVEPEPPPQT
jgi:molybdenum cofactor cytidylyltransferase